MLISLVFAIAAFIGVFAISLDQKEHGHQPQRHRHGHELQVICPAPATTAFHRHAGLLLQDQTEALQELTDEIKKLEAACDTFGEVP